MGVLPIFTVLTESQNTAAHKLGAVSSRDASSKDPRDASSRDPSRDDQERDRLPSKDWTGLQRRRRSSIPCISLLNIETQNIALLHANGQRWQTDEAAVQQIKARL